MTKIIGPDPSQIYPLPGNTSLVFLKNIIKAPNIHVGDYTYFDDRSGEPEKFEENNVLYNYHYSNYKLVIGKFCAIAFKTKFLMPSDHKLEAISTYPFPIFQSGWETAFSIDDFPIKGDIVVGNDVWMGYNSLIKNGVKIGDGAIIAANAVVVKDVPPYAVVAGNPAKVVKMRFDNTTIERLLNISWWNWGIEKINANLAHLCQLNVDKLEEVS